ncbi:MAG: hypothetical protein U1C19_08850 [Methanobacteriaceae archaeon]|nr:hypothetical protein [Methanobacteriaceae archaeon]
MDDKQIDFIMYIVGVIGLLVLLGGVFNLYEFRYGLIGAIVLWIIAGAAKRYPR